MEFYERLEQAKKTLKLTNEDLGNVVSKKADAFRLATVKRSLKGYDIKELELYLDKLENKIETKKPPPEDEGFSLKEFNEYLIKENEFLKEMLRKK